MIKYEIDLYKKTQQIDMFSNASAKENSGRLYPLRFLLKFDHLAEDELYLMTDTELRSHDASE
jgi:hypothetical protein